MQTIPAFSVDEEKRLKVLLATQVASMMGRKLEEGDWSAVYSKAKNIPDAGWSNLHIDINHGGVGVEQKVLRCAGLNGRPLKSVCGTTLMHPSATRSIRIDDATLPPDRVLKDVFRQYAELIELRTEAVAKTANGKKPDMRVGWLIWEDTLSEFLYFEEPMVKPDVKMYRAEWNITAPRGARKSSKSLWIYDKKTGQKRYSVTTSAGIKIQPYFDVPPPNDPNLYYFRVQSEPVGNNIIHMWISHSTAGALEKLIGALTLENVSQTVLTLAERVEAEGPAATVEAELAVAIPISLLAHQRLIAVVDGVSDEHRAQLMLRALS
jgi:hypothetical protein